MSDKFQNKYRIPSARAPWHNYNGGWYFITVCTKNMVCYFGNVVDSKMRLNELGQAIADNLRDVSKHYSYCEIPIYVVMPNHIHAIVIIDGEKTPYNRCDNCSRDVARRVSTPPTTPPPPTPTTKMTEIANYQGWLSVVIGGIKSAVTKFANQNNMSFVWQSRFHDHIIRNQDECNRITQYIENNPIKWELDKFFKTKSALKK